MSRGTKIGLTLGVIVLVAAGIAGYKIHQKKNQGTEVRMEKVGRRDLVSAVTASGKIEAKTSVDISADITGRIIRIAVREGDVVRKGQFLIQIDPAQYQAAVDRSQGVVSSTQATVLQARANRDQAERAWKRAQQLIQAGPNLITQESAEQAQTSYEVAQANYVSMQAQLDQARASLQEARDNLGKTRLTSPISGRVVRLAVEEGEVAVPGTFSKDVGLLMTIADLSVILAKVTTLIDLGRRGAPITHDRLARLARFAGSPDEAAAVHQAYELMPKANFSRTILETCPETLAVSKLPSLVWSDLGSPTRVMEAVARMPISPGWACGLGRPA